MLWGASIGPEMEDSGKVKNIKQLWVLGSTLRTAVNALVQLPFWKRFLKKLLILYGCSQLCQIGIDRFVQATESKKE